MVVIVHFQDKSQIFPLTILLNRKVFSILTKFEYSFVVILSTLVRCITLGLFPDGINICFTGLNHMAHTIKSLIHMMASQQILRWFQEALHPSLYITHRITWFYLCKWLEKHHRMGSVFRRPDVSSQTSQWTLETHETHHKPSLFRQKRKYCRCQLWYHVDFKDISGTSRYQRSKAMIIFTI